jgi:hypothetical protein
MGHRLASGTPRDGLLHAPATPAREVRAIEAAAVEFPQARGLLIAPGKPAVLPALAGGEVVSAVDWLLEVDACGKACAAA